MVEEAGTLEPIHVCRLVDDVITVQRGDGNGGDVDDVIETGGEGLIVLDNSVVDLLAVVDEIHLIDGNDDMLDAEKIGDEGMTLGLLDHSFTRIDKNDGKVGGGGTGHHVAGVLNMPRSVRDNKFTLWSREVAVGNVNRDALLALGFETVSKESEVYIFITLFA